MTRLGVRSVILPHSILRCQVQGLGALTCPLSLLETMLCYGTRQPLSPQYQTLRKSLLAHSHGRHHVGQDLQPYILNWLSLTNLGFNSSIVFLDISRITSPRMSINCPRRHPSTKLSSRQNLNSQPPQALDLKASRSPMQISLMATQMHRFHHHRCPHRENQQNQYTSAISQATR